jgi:DNA-binding response OmpR family regulator
VFTNLLSNAHKYTPSGGQIAVRAFVEQRQVIVTVQDNGIGMSAEEQAQLFTRFYRARTQLAGVVGGTGLGLAITRQLIELHGGTIGVQSAPDVGSVFRVALPVAPVDAIEAASPAANRTVLIVEDEPAIAGLLRQYLERDGYNVLVAATGAEAFRLAQSARPALITLDIGLPDVDGFGVLEWLKRQPETSSIPVLILSATEDRERGTLLGCIDYLVKPVGQDALLAHVRTHLAPDASPLVLIVDDEADVRSLLGATLLRAGYRVQEAASGATAIRLAQQQLPALLLMDVRMPGADGLETLRQLRAMPATRGVPVIMLTASPGAREESWALTRELAISQVLQKPCPADVLVAVIADVIGAGK